MKEINKDFFNLEIYSIYRAIGELWNKEAWRVVWRAGEILFLELNKKLKLRGKPIEEVLKSLANYLENIGYVDKIEVSFIKKDEIEYKMKNPSIEEVAFRLIKEGFAPPHISTALLIAALDKLFGLKIEIIGNPVQKNDWVIEKWKLKRKE
jgi:hypothetical protein